METNRTAPDADADAARTDGAGPGGEQGERTTDGPSGAGGSAPEDDARDARGAHHGSSGHHGTGGHQGASWQQGASGHHAPGAAAGPGVPGGAAADASASGFFAWLRRLGVPRRAGWLGGVCAGVAARIGLDPIVVRGIVVVLAVLGAPFVLVYALAWLLLPDAEGEIHFERLLRGTVDPAVIGILVLGAAGLAQLVQGGWLGWDWWTDLPSFVVPWFGFDLGWIARVLLVLALVGGLAWLVVWLAIRSSRGASTSNAPSSAPASSAPTSSAPASFAPASSAPSPESSGRSWPDDGSSAGHDRPLDEQLGAPLAPAAPASGASAEELADWRARQEAWRQSYAAWKSGQAEAARAARAQAAEENKARARELTAQADAARAARRASRPRASAAFVFTVLGLALVGGAIAAIATLTSGASDTAAFAVPIAIAVAALVLSAGMIVAALRRRRSGALAFFTATTVVAMLVSTGVASLVPAGSRVIGPNASISLSSSQQLVQPIGNAYLSLRTLFGPTGEPARVDLTQGVGDVWITIDAEDRLKLDLRAAGVVSIWVTGDDGATITTPQLGGLDRTFVVGGPQGIADDSDPVDSILVLRQGTGAVYVEIQED
ncbi:PspC domain-containing protein [Agromyces soli]